MEAVQDKRKAWLDDLLKDETEDFADMCVDGNGQVCQFIYVERDYEHEIIHVSGCESLQEVANELNQSDTSGVDYVDVWDVDTLTYWRPEKRVTGFFSASGVVKVRL